MRKFRQHGKGLAVTYSDRYADAFAIARRQLELMADWGSPIRPGSSVLELGGADGFSTAQIAEAGYTVTAVDYSDDMVIRAKEKVADYPKASVLQRDVRDYEPDEDF